MISCLEECTDVFFCTLRNAQGRKLGRTAEQKHLLKIGRLCTV